MRGNQGGPEGRAFPDTLLVGHVCCPPKGAQCSELLFALLPAPVARGASSSFSQRSGRRRQPALPRGAQGAGGGRTGRREGSARSSRRRRRSLARTRRARHRHHRPCRRRPNRCERAEGWPRHRGGAPRGAAGGASPQAGRREAAGGAGRPLCLRRTPATAAAGCDATAWPSCRPSPPPPRAAGSTSAMRCPWGAAGCAVSLHSASDSLGRPRVACPQEPGHATPGEHHTAGPCPCHPGYGLYGLSWLPTLSAIFLRTFTSVLLPPLGHVGYPTDKGCTNHENGRVLYTLESRQG